MNERIGDLLDHASDDGGAPLGFSGAALAQRAQRRRQRRYGAAAAGLAAMSVAGVLVAGQLLSSPGADRTGPAVDPSRSIASPLSASTSAPALSPQERSVVDRCAATRTPTRTRRFLDGWTLDAYVEDAQGLTATFVNPDRTRFARCNLADEGVGTDSEVTDGGPLPTGPVPQSWYGPDGFRHQATSPAWSQVCSPGDGKICPRELFAGAFALYDGVKALRVDAPDGTVLHPVLGTYTYVFRHTEQRVDPNRASNDDQPLPSMPVTLQDGQGRTIIRYDYYPSYIIPDSCPPTGGC